MKIENSTKMDFFKNTMRPLHGGLRSLALCAILLLPILAYGAPLDEAYKEYLSGDYEEALIKARRLPENDAVLYFLGLTYIKMSNYPQAREHLGELKKSFRHSKLYESALAKYADTYFLEGNFERARVLYEEIETKYPRGEYLPFAYLRLSQTAAKEGRWDDNEKYASFLKSKYPNSVEANFLEVLEDNVNFFTVQVGAFGQRKNASELKEELAKDYPAYVVEGKDSGNILYKVRVGKFQTRKEAEEIRSRLIRQGYPARIYP